jgi:hypothetical protein
MIAPFALFVALHAQPSPGTVLADTFTAAHPCTPRWSWGAHALGFTTPDDADNEVLICRVVWTPIIPRTPWVDGTWRMDGTWYRQDDLGWLKREPDGSWTRIEGKP